MTERPVFVPEPSIRPYVRTVLVQFRWHPGFAVTQKQKNVESLHAAAELRGLSPLLEISTKSLSELGRRLSAFSLKVQFEGQPLPLESVFQGSKVFEKGGPYVDLYAADPRSAKRDERVRNSGAIVGFRLGETDFPNAPRTLFYDWLYLSSLYSHRQWISANVPRYAGFTDVEFNPSRSVNCQARSFALLISLLKNGLLDTAMASPRRFAEVVWDHSGDQAKPG